MNEQIKEIALRSFVCDKEGIRFDHATEYMLQEFAELIVEECARLLINEAERNHDEDSMTYMTLIEEANWFRIYFGIE